MFIYDATTRDNGVLAERSGLLAGFEAVEFNSVVNNTVIELSCRLPCNGDERKQFTNVFGNVRTRIEPLTMVARSVVAVISCRPWNSEPRPVVSSRDERGRLIRNFRRV